ncbi:MAG: hypothetical protein IKT35_04615, partial [Clostridia bacterium]|nr:hypothetical protein [Clostridia bacterium]
MKRVIAILLAILMIVAGIPTMIVGAETTPPINYLLSNCDSTAGWATESSRGSLSLSTDAAVGSGSVKVTCSDEMYFFFISQAGALDFTHVTHFDFWFYTSDPNIFNYGDCGFNLSYSSAWANNGVAVVASSFKSLSLKQGWNHISVPLDFSGYNDSFDIENIIRFRFYSVGLPAGVSVTVAVDEVRAVNREGLEKVDQIAAQNAIDKINAIGTVNTYSRLAIADARSAYNALTDAQKNLVTNLDKLTAAETTFAAMGTPTQTTYTTLSNCDTMTGWEARNSVNTQKKTEGSGSIQQSITTQMMYYYSNTSGYNFTGATHMEFDLYVEDTSFFAHGDCGMNLSSVNTGAWWSEQGIQVQAASLKALTLKVGWNHIKVPLVFLTSPASSFNVTKVTNIRFYAVGFTTSTVVMIDDFKMVKEASGNNAVTIPDDMKNYKPDLSTEKEAWMVSSCDTSNGITVSSCENMYVVSAGSDTFTAFTGLSAGTVEVKAPRLSSSPISITGYDKNSLALRFQFYISDVSAIKNGQIEITSSGKPDANEINWTTSQLSLKNGWNVVYLDFADSNIKGDALSLTGINYMRIYMFLNRDAVMAYDDIKIVKRSVVAVSENFSTAGSLEKWNSTTAVLTRESEQLCISGNGQVDASSTQYSMPIVHPDRSPIEFELYAKQPSGVSNLMLTLTDSKGRTATTVLDTTNLSAYTATRYQIVPSEMTMQDKFNSETISKVTLSATLDNTTIIMDNFEVNVRNGQYWRDWVYNYKSTPGDYSIAVIPDIQELTAVYPDKLNTVMQWIVDNKQTENIQFAIDVGDVTWNGHAGNASEFQTAATAFKKLQDAGIDYSIAYGNHDYISGTPRNTDLLNQYFPQSNMSTFDSYGGVMTEGKIDNMYYCFEVQGNKYMIMALEFDPFPDTIAWANEVIAAHPEYQVIITTHNYMNNVYGQYSYAGQNLWPNLVSKHENVIMVICGHDCLTADPGSISCRVDKGEKGNTVHQLMVNSQDIDASRGGVGLLLMMRFTNGGKKVDLNYFSPVNNNLAYKPQNQFTLQLGDFTSNTNVEKPIYHLGLSTANSGDALWNDYRYVAQEFVPSQTDLYGAKVALNLTKGTATVHAEIRKEVNGEALYSTDVGITSKGDAVNWYDLNFGQQMKVEPGEAYYLVYYLTARDADSSCIVYGLEVGNNNATNPGYTWKMSNGGQANFTDDNSRLIF